MPSIKALPAELQKIAETELGEVPARISEDLQNLKNWIEKQAYLNARQEDQFLIQFLRGCKYSLERAKTKIDLFFTLKSKFPELFNVTDINDTKFRKMLNYGYAMPLPTPMNGNGARILFINVEGDIAKGLIDLEDLYSVVNAKHEIILMDDPYACINGIIYVLDLKQVTLNLVLKITPAFMRKLAQFYEKCLPFRIKAIHLLNTPGIFQAVINIFLPMLSGKLQQRVFVHSDDFTNPETGIPLKYLPTYLGGENGSAEEHIKDFERKFLEYENYFKENASYGTIELLRPGKPIDFDSIYGMGGSFRKLDVD